MQDAISIVINRCDLTGKYFDAQAANDLNTYFSTGLERIRISEAINAQSSRLINEASAQLYVEQPELLRPGGNSYTTRRYAACLRDIEYYLRYSSYAIVAGNTDILTERVLNGLKETYNSLGVPISPTIRSIQLLMEVMQENIGSYNDTSTKDIISEPFTYLIDSLSEKDT